jgi:hypothetical protein
MAENQEQNGDGKKKKCRIRPGRHLQQKRRVHLREQRNKVWHPDNAFYESTMQLLENLSLRSERSRKVFHGDNLMYPSFVALSNNLKFKRILADDPDAPLSLRYHRGKQLSKAVASKTRKQTRFTNRQDGSLAISNLAWQCGASERDVQAACHPYFGDGKKRFVLYEIFQRGQIEIRVAATGSHFFQVPSPVGSYLLVKCEACQQKKKLQKEMGEEEREEQREEERECNHLKEIFHRTDKDAEIRASKILSSMDRPGGVNCSLPGMRGYRDDSRYKITIDVEKTLNAGYALMQNRFSEVVFILGKWVNGGWDGCIPFDEELMRMEDTKKKVV